MPVLQHRTRFAPQPATGAPVSALLAPEMLSVGLTMQADWRHAIPWKFNADAGAGADACDAGASA
jgi:hypothetical protein